MSTPTNRPVAALRGALGRLSPKQRQYATLASILLGGIGMLWLIFAFTDNAPKDKGAKPAGGNPSAVTNIGVMPPGQQVNPVDQWVGTAGSKLAQYESEREEQGRLNKDRQAFEARTMQRFSDLEQRLTSAAQGALAAQTPTAAPQVPAPLPPAASLPLPPPPSPRLAGPGAMPAGQPNSSLAPLAAPAPPAPVITRVTLVDRSASTAVPGSAPPATGAVEARTVSTFLPVSFTRGTLLGGLDAPTGGQSQSNPHPVLIRLSDNSVLPNRFRGEYRDCFVIAAGYGDISSERAYLQGQMLANALLAGVVSGIGSGLATSSTTYSTSALGTIASASGADAYRAGLGTGVGKALDRLAQYYIKLAENTFPVIEVDAGREIDVVITKGVRIDVPMTAGADRDTRFEAAPSERYVEASDDGNY